MSLHQNNMREEIQTKHTYVNMLFYAPFQCVLKVNITKYVLQDKETVLGCTCVIKLAIHVIILIIKCSWLVEDRSNIPTDIS